MSYCNKPRLAGYFEEREKTSAAWLNFRERRGRVLLAFLSDRQVEMKSHSLCL